MLVSFIALVSEARYSTMNVNTYFQSAFEVADDGGGAHDPMRGLAGGMEEDRPVDYEYNSEMKAANETPLEEQPKIQGDDNFKW